MIESITFDMVQLRKHFSRYCGACLEKIGLSRGMLFFIIYIGKNPGCRPRKRDAMKINGFMFWS